MSKKQDKPETPFLSKEEVWQRSPKITRSQIFASGTVQRWLELADQAFESDAASEETAAVNETPAVIPADKSISSQDENRRPKLVARAKSA